jgi:hypothetical protein
MGFFTRKKQNSMGIPATPKTGETSEIA